MIAVFYGKNEFAVHEALDALRTELDGDGQLVHNTVQVDGAQAKPGELLDQCRTIPFLGSRRLIVVRDLLSRFDGRRRGKRTAEETLGDWGPFVQALPELPETTALVFIDGDVRAQNVLLQALRGNAEVKEFKELKQGDLAGWISRRAQLLGIPVEARAVATLAGLVGTDLWLIDSELRKLATYAGDRPVSEDDVRSLVSLAREPNVFAMADAVIEGRSGDAIDLVQKLLADGDTAQRLLAMIARQYRLLLLTKEQLDGGARPPDIATRVGVPPFALQRLLKQAPRYDIDGLRRAYGRLLEADLNVKRGLYDDGTSLHLLVFELAGATPDGRPGYSRPQAGRGPARSAPARA